MLLKAQFYYVFSLVIELKEEELITMNIDELNERSEPNGVNERQPGRDTQ